VEFIRTNKPVALGLTQQQWISVALFVIGIAGIWWFETHGRLRPALGDKNVVAPVVAPAPGGRRSR
jgi:prolipoprotein diacylglyceryltransferase